MPLPDGAKGGAVQECGRALAAFYEEVGVDGGGSGTLFGLRIDHVPRVCNVCNVQLGAVACRFLTICST